MNKKIYAVYGASGYGRECLPLLKASIDTDSSLFFIDDRLGGTQINNTTVLHYDDFLRLEGDKFCSIAIANSQVRENLQQKLAQDKISSLSILADNATLYQETDIGAGYILNPYSCVTADCRIGKYLHANVHSYIAHDCVLGDFVTLAPGAIICGNVHIGDHVYIGANAVIKQGSPDKPLVIGAHAVIGMGAVVTKDVPAGTTVVGSPARPFIKA